MTRPALARLAACLLAGLVAVGLAPLSPPPALAAEPDTPLAVSIDSLAPSVIPRRGEITITGQITNQSDSTWTDLKVYMLTSPEPLTTGLALEEAAATDPATEIGGRLFKAGLYDEVGDLQPGSSTGYTLSVPRRALRISGAPGAYWLGVHVLGAEDGVRDAVADGRARTFIPLMRRSDPSTSLALVVPVKAQVRREPDGRLSDLDAWQELLGAEGRLGRLLDLSGTTVDVPLTWVVDPAVVDAARAVAADNPPMNVEPTDEDDEPNASPSPSGSASASPSEDTSDGSDAGSDEGSDGEEEPAELSPEAQVAQRWLSTFRRQSEQHAVLATPYGDIDVAAMLRADLVDLYDQATELSADTMETLGVDADPVVAPPSGFLPNVALPKIDSDTPLLLTDHAAPATADSVVRTRSGQPMVLADTSAGTGGPGPGPRLRALAMRQRILSEAAVHALSSSRDQPLVVATPTAWDPGSDWRLANFFAGLDVPWLRAVDLPTALLGSSGADEYGQSLAYPRRERRAELPLANLLATQELAHVGNVYADLLTRNDTVDEFLGRTAMLGSSYRDRPRPRAALASTRAAIEVIRSRMEQVTIDGPSFVTMSSEDGTFAVTVVNGLEQPVTVGVDASVVGDDLKITSREPVDLGPGQRASVRLGAHASDIGVHSVSLMPVNSNGEPLGSVTKFSVRSSQVGLVIWVIMGLGGAVLVVASAIRIVRRVRARKATHGPLLKDPAS